MFFYQLNDCVDLSNCLHSWSNEIDFRVREAKMLMVLKVHWDGFKPVSSLEWRSAIAFMR